MSLAYRARGPSLLLFIGCGLPLAALAVPVVGQVYSLMDLGTLGGNAGVPRSINSVGVVAGESRTAGNVRRPVRWTSAGTISDLGSLGGTSGVAYSVNAAGTIVGAARNGANADTAFIWDSVNGMRV